MRKKIKVLIISLSILIAGGISITFGVLAYINAPSARFGYGLVYDTSINKVILFGGGFQDSISFTYYDDTWIYDPVANIWTEIFPEQNPSARSSHSMVYDPINQKIILFGGVDLNDNWKSDTWIFDSRLNSWTQVFPEYNPPSRGSASAYYDLQIQQVILYGGYRDIGGNLDDTWAYDYPTNNWTNLDPLTKPEGRYGAPMIYDPVNQRGFMFGGRNSASTITNDNWVYYSSNNSWADLGLISKPSNRYWEGLVYDGSAQTVILYGGRGTGGVGDALDDTWIYDPSLNQWIEVFPSSNPSYRFDFSLVYNSLDQEIILFGGFRFPDICFGDTWGYDHSTNNWNKLK